MKRLSSRRMSGFSDQTVNPMDGLGNLADAMLVLAVGIMLSLIIHWKVDIAASTDEAQEAMDAQTQQQQQIAIDESAMQSQSEPVSGDAQHVGELYYDEATGSYYLTMEE